MCNMDFIVDNTVRLNQIEQFPQVRLTHDDIHSSCSICICSLTKDEIILILPCVHKFHRYCIIPWLLENSSCPTCREKVLQDIDADADSENNSDEDIAVDLSDNSYSGQMSSPDHINYAELLDSYFDAATDDTLSNVSFQFSEDSDQSSFDTDMHIVTTTTIEIEMGSDDDDHSVISVSDRSADESHNIGDVSDFPSGDSSASESFEGNDASGFVFSDSDNDLLGMLSDDDSSD